MPDSVLTPSTFFFQNGKAKFSDPSRTGDVTDDFESRVKDFAWEWLSGKSSFEFQTSGLTGVPKLVVFSRKQMEASAELTQNTFDLKKGQTALLCLDPNFVAGKMMIVRALHIGMDMVCLAPSANPLTGLKLNSSIDFAAFVPYQLEAILKDSSAVKKLSLVKKAIIGGAPVSTELTEKLQGLSTQFYETYGMTETLTHVAIRKLNPPEDAFHTLPGVKIYLGGNLCLSIQANHLGNDIIRTKDLVNIFSESSFRPTGRYDNIINTAGLKVLPEDIERKILPILTDQLPGCDYFIAGVADSSFGQKVVLFVESTLITDSKKENLTKAFRENLRAWEVPKEVVCVSGFRRTKSGKVNRNETAYAAIHSN